MQKQIEHTFEQLIEENKSKIFRLCRIYAISPIEPRDLFQEVIYQIWKSLSTFKDKSNINTWVYKIALNVCIRSKVKLKKSLDNTLRLESIHFKLDDKTLLENEEEKYRVLHDCISVLSPSNKLIVILSLEELAYKEIAEITGLTENHIAVKMKRIRKILLKCITSK